MGPPLAGSKKCQMGRPLSVEKSSVVQAPFWPFALTWMLSLFTKVHPGTIVLLWMASHPNAKVGCTHAGTMAIRQLAWQLRKNCRIPMPNGKEHSGLFSSLQRKVAEERSL
ncbi:hypothetical protein AA0229_0581 [Gluconobacter cerinus NRIC 0229]|nr:hypothetical protein AA0229_0581 [Gluconobacter cerinus NRIC 0229]